MSRVFLPLPAVVSLGFAPAPFATPAKPDPIKEDLKKLQGEWVRSHLSIGGKVLQGAWVTCTITIRGNRLQFPSPTDAWLIRLDPARKPKLIDYQGATPDTEKAVYRGVYRLEGDTLTVCIREGVAEKDRPADFDGKGQGRWLQVFKRKKP